MVLWQDAHVVLSHGLEALDELHAANLMPTTENFNYILYAVGRAQNASPALLDRTLAEFIRRGLQPDTKTYNLLLSACKSRGPRVKMHAKASADPLQRTLELLTRMESARVRRDDFTYTLVFSACSRAAREDGPRGLRLARDFVREMTTDGVVPSTFTLNAAIDVCAKAVRAGGPVAVASCLDLALSLFARLHTVSDSGDGGVSCEAVAAAGMMMPAPPTSAPGHAPGSGSPPACPQPAQAATPVTYTSLLDLASSALRARGR